MYDCELLFIINRHTHVYGLPYKDQVVNFYLFLSYKLLLWLQLVRYWCTLCGDPKVIGCVQGNSREYM